LQENERGVDNEARATGAHFCYTKPRLHLEAVRVGHARAERLRVDHVHLVLVELLYPQMLHVLARLGADDSHQCDIVLELSCLDTILESPLTDLQIYTNEKVEDFKIYFLRESYRVEIL
jgi:hypothetical protein